VGFAASRILDERLSLLDHLYIRVLDEGAVNIKVEKGCYAFESLFDVLGICLELTLADAVVDEAEFSEWV